MQKLKSMLFSFAYIYIYICFINFSYLYSQTPLKTITLDVQQFVVIANELCVKLKSGVSEQTLQNFEIIQNSNLNGGYYRLIKMGNLNHKKFSLIK